MGHIGDVDSDLVVTVVQFLERKRIVKVLGVRRVYRECQCVAEVSALLDVLFRDLVRDLVGGVLHLRLEPVRQGIFSENGMHLRVVLARHSEYIHDVAFRSRLALVPAVDQSRHFHSSFRALWKGVEIYADVVRHIPGLHQHPCLPSDNMQHTDERLVAALYYLNDLTLTAFGRIFSAASSL